ncbi:hypothetical protein Cgig2_014309 [Carnegiea gigantea]|uniref:glutamate--cysteine ligase n=1 Tax=Carnegiea gigantea TaxID=171969 RepID=A0A9Q1JWI7_9CARY|nr:hypothetical protein Cgig2_014309 [Carnegiea gigantea]
MPAQGLGSQVVRDAGSVLWYLKTGGPKTERDAGEDQGGTMLRCSPSTTHHCRQPVTADGRYLRSPRLKRYLEMRGADGGPWRRLCALPALWVGLLYDKDSLQSVLDMTADWTNEEREMLRNKVPKFGLKTPFRDGYVKHIAEDVLKLAKDGLERRGFKEIGFLNEVAEVVRTGVTPAERLLELYHGKWGENVDPFSLSPNHWLAGISCLLPCPLPSLPPHPPTYSVFCATFATYPPRKTEFQVMAAEFGPFRFPPDDLFPCTSSDDGVQGVSGDIYGHFSNLSAWHR